MTFIFRKTREFFFAIPSQLRISGSTDQELSRLILKNLMEIKDGQTLLVKSYGNTVNYIEQHEDKETMFNSEIAVENENI